MSGSTEQLQVSAQASFCIRKWKLWLVGRADCHRESADEKQRDHTFERANWTEQKLSKKNMTALKKAGF